MISTSTILKNLIEENLELSKLWNRKILNLTALAKELKPEVDQRLDLKTELSSLIVSLNRLSKSWKVENTIPKIEIKSVQIIKNVTTLVYKRSPKVVRTIMDIKDSLLYLEDVYITYEVGRNEIIFSTEMLYLSKFKKELESIELECKSQLEDLISVSFDLSSYKENQNILENFLHYAVLHKLAQSNIPVTRMKSCGSKFDFLIKEQYLDQVYKFWQNEK